MRVTRNANAIPRLGAPWFPSPSVPVDRQLSPLCRVESLGQLRIILDTSTCPYAQYFVASSLLRLVADHWNLLQDPQKLELQQWLLKAGVALITWRLLLRVLLLLLTLFPRCGICHLLFGIYGT